MTLVHKHKRRIWQTLLNVLRGIRYEGNSLGNLSEQRSLIPIILFWIQIRFVKLNFNKELRSIKVKI